MLVDEIDKAETDVPNGLLEALGNGQFTPFGHVDAVVSGEPQPLVVITTNEERALPDAFVRRCLVLHLALPEGKALETHLVSRGKAHFPDMADEVLSMAAGQLAKDRRDAVEARFRPLPGQAEYLDLLRALHHLAPGDAEKQEKLLAELAPFTLKKRAGAG